MKLTIVQQYIAINYWPGRAGRSVKALVLHTAEGTRAGVTSWFNDPDSEASAHALVCKDGTIVEYVRAEDRAWANGILQNPDTGLALVRRWVDGGINPNAETFSIEHERMHYYDALTDAQYAASVAYSAQRCRDFKLTPDRDHILRHSDLDSVDRPNCPGRLDQEAYIAAVAAQLSGGVPGEVVTSDDGVSTRLQAAYHALPPYLRGSEANEVFYEAGLDFSGVPGAPVALGHGLVAEYVTLWSAPGQPVRALQPPTLAMLAASGKVVRY